MRRPLHWLSVHSIASQVYWSSPVIVDRRLLLDQKFVAATSSLALPSELAERRITAHQKEAGAVVL